MNLRSLMADLQREPWAMEPRYLEALLVKLHAIADADVPAEILASTTARARELRPVKMTIAGGVATIPISGSLMASVPLWVRWFGIDATGYDEIVDDLKAAAANPDVKAITLAIESPGGQAAGAFDVADVVGSLTPHKPVTAEARGLMASAAYLIGSQARAIVIGPNAMIGSIGVYSALYDATAMAAKEGVKVHRIASAPYKGAGLFGAEVTPEHLKDAQRIVDAIAQNFKTYVAKGRGASAETVESWATGQLWIGEESRRMGLADQVAARAGMVPGGPAAEAAGTNDTQDSSRGVPAAADLTQKGETMTDTEKAAAAAAEKARSEAQAAERKRLDDLKAAFPRDLAFATESFSKGLSVEQAKAAYADVAMARAERAEQETANLKAAAAEAAKGGTPIPHAGIEGGSTPRPDFMALADADRAEHVKTCSVRPTNPKAECCTRTAAMQRVARAKPEVHSAYVARQVERAPEVRKRKLALGMS